jgi:hypothetical protein
MSRTNALYIGPLVPLVLPQLRSHVSGGLVLILGGVAVGSWAVRVPRHAPAAASAP